jgi:hypothetical protein
MNIEQILRTPHSQPRSKEEIEAIDGYFTEQISKFAAAGDEPHANHWALLQMIFEAQNNYIRVYSLFKSQEYYASWCLLERIEIDIKSILRLHQFVDDEYRIKFIFEYVRKLQSLFPYKIFGSSEFIKEIVRCGICNELVTLRKRCAHVKGQLYMGRMCVHNVEKAHFLAFSIVDVPFNKYSVAGVTGKADDDYVYTNLEYLQQIIDHPFNEWRTEDSKVFKPHDEFTAGRNDQCPCCSGKKYKNCCLHKPGVEIDNTEFILKYPTLNSQKMLRK